MKKVNMALRAAVFALVCLATSLPMTTDCAKDTEKSNDSWFSLATLASIWGVIKNNCEFSTNLTGVLTGPIEKKPLEVSMKLNSKIFKPAESIHPYTASMAHLTQILPHKDLILTPKPFSKKTKWFWNDGDFTDKEKTAYQITHEGITYCYAYDKEKKSWEPTGKNRMSYLTYYNYLLKNKQPLRPFIEYLITEMMNFSPVNFESRRKRINNFFKVFTKALLNEELYKNKYVFYTGYQGRYDFCYDFVRALNEILENQNGEVERSRFETHPQYSSVDEFIDKEYDFSYDFDTHKGNNFLMPTNLALFGNSYLSGKNVYLGESSCNYFCFDYSNRYEDEDHSRRIVENLCKAVGLTGPKELEQLRMDYLVEMSGKLKQTFLDPLHVDKFSYLSTFFGHPRTLYDDAFTKSVITQITKKPKLGGNDIKFLTTGNVIGLLRTDPENSCFRLPIYPAPNPKDFRAKITDPAINTLQARVDQFTPPFFDQEAAKKAGRQTIYYYSCKEDKILHEKLRARMYYLVEQMVTKAREEKTLKVDGLKQKTGL